MTVFKDFSYGTHERQKRLIAVRKLYRSQDELRINIEVN